MDFYKLFCDVLPAWLSGIVAIVAIIISCKSSRKSNKLQEEIADDNNKLLKDIQIRDANMRLYELRLEVYSAFMTALYSEHRINELKAQRTTLGEKAMFAVTEEVKKNKINLEKAQNIACFCFSKDEKLQEVIRKAQCKYIIFCDEILKNMPLAQEIAKDVAVTVMTKYPCVDQISDKNKIDLFDAEFNKLYGEKLSDISKDADAAFDEYKHLVSYDNFGRLFEKYLLPEAIMVR